jgi:hypothetical protein
VVGMFVVARRAVQMGVRRVGWDGGAKGAEPPFEPGVWDGVKRVSSELRSRARVKGEKNRSSN